MNQELLEKIEPIVRKLQAYHRYEVKGIENVPEEYRTIGTTIAMENSAGKVMNFLVTRMDEKTLTIDGNNPLCGREVVFTLEVLKVRDATEVEVEAGGRDIDEVKLDETLMPARFAVFEAV